MQNPGKSLRQIIDQAAPKLLKISADRAATPSQAGKWSPAEIIGHLIDSASNNHGRFLRAQQTDELIGLPYDQDFWVQQQGYRTADWHELVQLWAAFNRQLARLMDATPEEILVKKRTKHNLDQIAYKTVPADQSVTLHYFMVDYVAHLEHHLGQVLL
jgi:hypothetical protein